MTQTFEPITIAEFEENAVIEEVVVAEDYSIAKQDIDESSNAIVNEHDYIELANDTGPQIKRPRLSYEEKPNLETFLQAGQGTYFTQEGHYEEVERKPVIAPVIKDRRVLSGSTEIKTIKIEKPDVEKANHTSVIKRLTPELIEETVRNHKNKLEQANNVVSEASSHVLEQVVVEAVGTGTDLSRVIEETIGRESVSTEEEHEEELNLVKKVPVENDIDKLVNIEELVDVCFEEELQKSVIEEESIIVEEIISKTDLVEDITENLKSTNVKVIQRARKVTGSKKRRQSGTLLPLKKRRTHFNQTIALNSHKVPFIGFTVEENLRVKDLVNKRICVQENFKQLMKMDSGENGKKAFKIISFDLHKKRDIISSLSLSAFEEFGNIERGLAYRGIHESWPAVAVAEWAAWESLKTSGLAEQLRFMGWEGVPGDQVLGQDGKEGTAVKNTSIFTSPWAANVDDEKVFIKVLESVGELLDGDSKLAVLFLMLVMTSEKSFSLANQEFLNLQSKLSLLLFRYLTSKMQTSVAAARAQDLLGFLRNMHRCGNIYMNMKVVV